LDTLQLSAIEREFVAYAVAQTSPHVRAWRGDQLAADLARAMGPAVALLSDEDTAGDFAEAMSLLGLAPEHFKAKLLDIDGHRFLAQIDFTSTAGDTPFVAIFRGSRLLGAFETRAMVDAIANGFAIFAPAAVRFFHPSHIPMVLPGARVDQHFLAAPVRDMLAREPAPGVSRVTLTAASGLDFFPRYNECYAQVFAARPELQGEVSVESEESLADCLAENLLFEIAVDGAWAGIVAARRQTLAGLDSIFMVEIVLDRDARGQGLGPAVHQHFAREVARIDPNAIVSGTIAAVNVPSLKTARRAGRIEIGAWYWVDL
jgi:GNAT superfamily N-acetyltransferase